jgi:hypothetical protein
VGLANRAEARAQCIDTATDAFIQQWFGCSKIGHRLREEVKMAITAAFDALHGLARVNPIEATEEMVEIAYDNGGLFHDGIKRRFDAMSAAGDLTNPPPDTDAEIAMRRRGGASGASLDEMAEKYDLTQPPEKKP